MAERAIGIDLGTTNSALAWADTRGPVRIFDVPQLVAPGEMGQLAMLPSFLYFPTEGEIAAGMVRLPWTVSPDAIAGVFARDHGALVPARQVSSTKSWLSNALVDRTAPLLPWGVETDFRMSPVEASTRLLVHFREAWNHAHAAEGDAQRLERLPVVVTVPASFDEEARELTVQAARAAGLERLRVLEEPLAALYAWIAAHRASLRDLISENALILVCDVGGGTTDFSLVRAGEEAGEVTFERIAIGEHLLLGGDNLDLALAVRVERKFGAGVKLTLGQRQTLRRKCSAAKELLLADPDRIAVQITILGAGRGVVGGGMTAELTRDEVIEALTSGFLPLTARDDLPARDRRAGLRELGLPYETEPAITKHLAGFLDRACRQAGGDVRPTAVLFNGGFFTPAIARERLLDALASWFGERPAVLESPHPESAVAVGAAFYGRLVQHPDAAKRLLIRAGSARTYYVGVAAQESARTAVCVMPRGTQEGTRFELDRELTVITNQPAAFTLYSSTERSDALGAVVTFAEGEDVQKHAPLTTALRYGKRSRREPLAVRLTAAFTETGTLELWCESKTTEHRWRLAFNLRALEADPLDEAIETAGASAPSTGVVIPDEAITRASQLIRDVFGATSHPVKPEALVGELENALGHGKAAWPLETIRKLADVLIELAAGRTKSPAHEVRWLNLTGFCIRPGFGSSADAWRMTELRKVYAAGLTFPKEIQGQVEWLVLWQRTSAGFTAGQQRELAQRVSGGLAIGQRKPPRLNPQIERESWRLLGGLERLDAGHRTKLGDELLARLRRDARNSAGLWALSRFGARAPLYGPLNSVVGPNVAERWIDALLGFKGVSPDLVSAILLIGARTGDPARDISPDLADRAFTWLKEAGIDGGLLRGLREPLPQDRVDAGRVFGESLPEGLRLG